MWKGAEHELCPLDGGIIGRDELDVAASGGQVFSPSFVGGGEDEFKSRMGAQKVTELASGVTARAEDSHRDSMHT